MSIGHFEVEESDIVRLVHNKGNASGWVNIGEHAVCLELVNGDIRVEICARTNESEILGVATATKAASIAAGGKDPDIVETSDGVKSISDDDLCSRCGHCDYRPGEMSQCELNWPGEEDEDGYIQVCVELADKVQATPGDVEDRQECIEPQETGSLEEWDALSAEEQASQWEDFHDRCTLGIADEMHFYRVMMNKHLVDYVGH